MKCINPTNHTTKGRIFLSTCTTEPLRGLPYSLLLVIIIIPPHRPTCTLLPPWPPYSSTYIFCKGVCCTGDRHRAGVDTGEARPPPLPGSTFTVSLPEHWICRCDGYDDTSLRCIKFYATLSLSCSSLYLGVSFISIVPALPLQKVRIGFPQRDYEYIRIIIYIFFQ